MDVADAIYKEITQTTLHNHTEPTAIYGTQELRIQMIKFKTEEGKYVYGLAPDNLQEVLFGIPFYPILSTSKDGKQFRVVACLKEE